MYLDALDGDDCETLRMWRNRDISGLRTPYFLTDEMQFKFYEDIVCDRSSPHRYFAVRDPELVAVAGLTNIEWENSLTEISLIVDPEKQRQGVGKESVRLVLEYAFNQLGMRMVIGECYYNNPKAIKFWEGILKQYQGQQQDLRCRKFWEGKYWDSLYFSICLHEYLQSNSTLQSS